MQNTVDRVHHNLMVAIEACTGMRFRVIGSFQGWRILTEAIKKQEYAIVWFGGVHLNWNPKDWELTFTDKRGLSNPDLLSGKFNREVFIKEGGGKSGTWVFSFATDQIKYLKALGVDEGNILKAA